MDLAFTPVYRDNSRLSVLVIIVWVAFVSIHNVVPETESNPSYHRLIFYETVGDFAFTLKARTVALRNFGPSMSPANSFHIITGIESLPVHMERHISNAGAKAEFLEKQDAVDWLSYAGLTSSPYHGLAKTYIPIGQGSAFTFVVCSGYEAVIKLVKSTNLFSLLANIGDTRS